MPFYLHIEVQTRLPPAARYDLILKPLMDALAAEGVGQVIDPDATRADWERDPAGPAEIGVEVTDLERGRALADQVLAPFRGGHDTSGGETGPVSPGLDPPVADRY